MFKIPKAIRKKKTGKGRWDPLPVAVYIFETETGSCDPVSDYFFVTVLIPVSARTHPSSAEPPIEIRLWMPAIRACQKFLHPLFQIVRAESFAVLWVWLWVPFQAAQRFREIRFVRAVGYGVFVWINIAVIQIFKCVHGFHPFPSQTPYHSLCRKSGTFQNKNDNSQKTTCDSVKNMI